MPIFVLFLSIGVLFDGNFSLWVSLPTNLAFSTFCLSEEMKDKCIASIQKQIIMNIINWWRKSDPQTHIGFTLKLFVL